MFNANILRPVKFNDSTFDSGKILFVLILYIRKSTGYLLLDEQHI